MSTVPVVTPDQYNQILYMLKGKTTETTASIATAPNSLGIITALMSNMTNNSLIVDTDVRKGDKVSPRAYPTILLRYTSSEKVPNDHVPLPTPTVVVPPADPIQLVELVPHLPVAQHVPPIPRHSS
ncbi:hypothetical protein H5410_036886 [Solanum commersonii]|uniref:Uncharacterized protein n=1 Tax=Solanum commersonii TaxID=4109 RepID=A0A9J5Y9I6_SOLCO|nr:hypothetical protein H5410_036886 [Solanum commersonii]